MAAGYSVEYPDSEHITMSSPDPKNAAAKDALRRATQSRTVNPTAGMTSTTQGIAQGVGANGERAFGDAAARSAGALGRAASKIPTLAAAASRAAPGIGAAGRTLGRVAGPAAVVGIEALDAANTFRDPNATGFDKAAAVSKGIGRGAATLAGAGLGAAAGSVVPFVGTAAGGIAGGALGYFGGDKAIDYGRRMLGVGDAPAGAAPTLAPAPAGKPASGSGIPLASAQNPAPNNSVLGSLIGNAGGGGTSAPQANDTIYHKGTNFSDQPIKGGEAYVPGVTDTGKSGGNVNIVSPSFFTGTGIAGPSPQSAPPAGSLDARARQAQDFAASTATENAISQRNGYEEAARRARQAAGSLRLVRGGRTQRQLLGDAADLTNKSLDAQGRVGTDPRFIRTPEQEQALAVGAAQAAQQAAQGEQQNALTQQQAIAQGLQNQGAQRQQSIIDQLGADPSLANRRGLIDSILISQGKDPDAARFQAIESVGGNDAFPIKTRSLYDTRTGQIIGGQAPAATPQATERVKNQIYTDAQGRRAKWDGQQFVPVS